MIVRVTRLVSVSLFVAASLILTGCGSGKPEAKAPPPPKVTVAVPVAHPVESYAYFNGYLDAIDSVEVRARVKGILRKKLFEEGTEVKKGDLLYEIDDREFKTAVKKAEAEVKKADADILNWKAQIRGDEAELTRVKDQLSKGVGIPADKDQAEAKVGVAQAQLDAAIANKESAEAALHTANIQLGYTQVKAEIGGRVNRTLVTEGNLLGQDEPTLLTTIVRMDKLYVHFDAPERELVAYQRELRSKGQTGLPTGGIPIEIGVATEDNYPHPGSINFRENRVDTGSGTIRIRGTLNNDDRVLYPGLYAHVRITSGSPEPRLLIPEAALMTGQEGQFVYVVMPDNKTEKRTVIAGSKLGELVAIEKGITAQDRVVIKGLQRVRPGSPVQPEIVVLTLPKDSVIKP